MKLFRRKDREEMVGEAGRSPQRPGLRDRLAYAKTKPEKPAKPKLIEPEKPKAVIVKRYQGWGSQGAFERDAVKYAEQGYAVQTVTAMGQQISEIKTKTKGSSIGLAAGVRFGHDDSKGKVVSTDGGILVTYALTEERKAEYALALETSKATYTADVESYPARLAAYEAALEAWKAGRPY